MVAGWKEICARYLVFVLLITGSSGLLAQGSPFDPKWTAEAGQIRETVDCFADRSLYITGEEIHFRARISFKGPELSAPWSTVLYVELVSSDGKRMSGGKYPVSRQVSAGEIRIPGDLLTGRYYLRAYTRWMRNRGPESFCYLPLRIVNPYRSEVYQPVSPESDEAHLQVTMDQGFDLVFEEFQASYPMGDSVVLDLLVSGDLPGQVADGCLSVVPLSAVPEYGREGLQPSGDNFLLDFLPDRYGPSLSGSVQYPELPADSVPPAQIHFTLLGDAAGYLVCRSDSRGRFSVGLPMRRGKLEIFVQPEDREGKNLQVLVDQDFEPRQLHFSYSNPGFSDRESADLTLMARKVQLAGIYGQRDSLPGEDPAGEETLFYGTPTFTVDLDDYVLLPTLREVFLNLVPSITPITRRGRTTLLIESVNPSLSLYESLVMVDQVPVLDMEHFMSLSPAKIKRIDVVEDVYVKGEARFGGIINLISRDHDMGGIDLPGNSFFIDYQALQPVSNESEPGYAPEDQIPDMRNTILWLPDVQLQQEIPSRISFAAPDYPGTYMVFFQGYSPEGKAVRIESPITFR